MYGSLFIFFLFVYPSNPSCYIGRRQQMSRDISHRAPVEITRRRGGVSHTKGFERRRERSASPGLDAGPASAAVAAEQDKTWPRATSNGAGRRSEHKHTCLLISLLAKRITQVQTARDSASTWKGYVNIFGGM